MLTLLEPRIPGNREIRFGEFQKQPVKKKVRTYVLNSRPGITGDYITDAQVEQNPDNPVDCYVTMSFDTKGGRIFEKLTGDNAGKRMAIVLEGKVNSAPQIQEKIGGGRARITLGSAQSPSDRFLEARDLAVLLKAGALPAPIRFLKVDVRKKK